jgi:hypothetical protein
MRHSITLTTATPIATAKAKSRTSSMTIFRLPDASGHLDPATGPVNEIPSLTWKNKINAGGDPDHLSVPRSRAIAVRSSSARLRWVIHRCVLLVWGTPLGTSPEAEHTAPEWQDAMQALMLVARDGPTMFARIGVMRALNRHVERVFNPDRKVTHWGKRKLKRDMD